MAGDGLSRRRRAHNGSLSDAANYATNLWLLTRSQHGLAGSVEWLRRPVPQQRRNRDDHHNRPHHSGAGRSRGVDRAQLSPAAGGDRRCRGRLGHRRRRPALPGLPGRLLGAELRAPAPGPDRRRARAAGPGHADQPRVRARPVRAVLPRAGRALRHRHGAADEHRRRGRRDRDQAGPQVGLPGQGRAGRAGEDHRRGRQLPRPHHHDHLLLHRSGRDATTSARTRPGFEIVPYGDLDGAGRRRSTTTPSPC